MRVMLDACARRGPGLNEARFGKPKSDTRVDQSGLRISFALFARERRVKLGQRVYGCACMACRRVRRRCSRVLVSRFEQLLRLHALGPSACAQKLSVFLVQIP